MIRTQREGEALIESYAMSAFQAPPAPVATETLVEPTGHPMRPWLKGMMVFLVVLLAGGSLASWLGRTPEPETFTVTGAETYLVLRAPTQGVDDPMAFIQGAVGPKFMDFQTVEIVAGVETDHGQVDLVVFTGDRDEAVHLTCKGSVTDGVANPTCVAGETVGPSWTWGETSIGGFFGTKYQSLTMFDPPEGSVSMFVLLDSNKYVGANIRDDASYLSWDQDLGEGKRLVFVNAGGVQIETHELQ